MKNKLIRYGIYALILALLFYVLPLAVQDTGSGMLVLLLVLPMLTFVMSLIYGVRCGFDILLPIMVAVLFTPAIFIHFNTSAWVYIPAYAVIALTGNGVGRIFYRRK